MMKLALWRKHKMRRSDAGLMASGEAAVVKVVDDPLRFGKDVGE